ncbi:hypothetical protein DFJ74DRAFT_672997 [Hyaloraphidium curvatum]|nr:hypothetical protein DFJ74DRAFT_672997 [Hyaloraphidium curvatum]
MAAEGAAPDGAAADFDTRVQAGWEARAHLFTNSYDGATRAPLDGGRGAVKQLIPGHFAAKRQSSVAADAAAARSIAVDAPFAPEKFHFGKTKPEETICWVGDAIDAVFAGPPGSAPPQLPDGEGDPHMILINASPVVPFHSLLVPRPRAGLPQNLRDWKQVLLPLEVVCTLCTRPDARLLFNSLGAYASVNHLHTHLTYLGDLFPHLDGRYPIEVVSRTSLHSHRVGQNELTLELTSGWPLPAFAFTLHTPRPPRSALVPLARAAGALLSHLVAANRAHNVIFLPHPFPAILVVPRKHQATLSSAGEGMSIAVAVAEISGLPIFGDPEKFAAFGQADYEAVLLEYALDAEEMERLAEVATKAVDAEADGWIETPNGNQNGTDLKS